MKLFDCIDGLLAGTKYLAWAIALAGILGSAVLFFVNLPLGFGSAAVFIASLFLSTGVTLLLLPGQLAKGKLESNKKYAAGAVTLVLATVIMGIVYFTNGGFPELNLMFVQQFNEWQ